MNLAAADQGSGPDAPLYAWADALTSCLREAFGEAAQPAAVLASTASTQDAAARMLPADRVGVLVAGRQTSGRGRRGASWRDDAAADGTGLGIAMTLSLPADRHPGLGDASTLSLASGVATARTVAAAVGRGRVGLKWPNDLLEIGTDAKLAGTLIERSGDRWLIGIGINVHHSPDELAALPGRASIRSLGAPCDRLEMMCGWLAAMGRASRLGGQALLDAWRSFDCLTGRHATIRADGEAYEGLVESIDPSMMLVLRTREGLVRLPAANATVERLGASWTPPSRR